MIFSGKERKSLGTGKCEGWEPDSVKCENQAVRSVKWIRISGESPDGEQHGNKAGGASDEIGDWFRKEDSGGSKTCDFRKE